MAEPDAVSLPDLAKVRGWLLVFTILLLPHGVGAPFLLSRQLSMGPPVSGPEVLALASLAVTAFGNLAGVFLVLTRNRMAPAFFTIYLPLLMCLLLLDPDPIATANARLAALGSSEEMTPGRMWFVGVMNFALVVLMVAYWVRAKRVQAVFGTRGLALLRRKGRE